MATVTPAQAVILCGGFGTRLGPLTARCPKPLLPVAGVPFLEMLIFELVRQGIQRILLLAAFEATQIEDFARSLPGRLPHPVRISVARESQPAGTSGALWEARDQLEERFLLLNGDSWFDVLVADVAAAQLARPGLLGALTLRPVADGSRYGCVQLLDGILTAFEERGAASGPALINGGVYCFDKKVIQYLVPNGSLEREVLPRLTTQATLAGIERSNFFIDIGVPSDLSVAQSRVPAQRRRPAIFFSSEGLLNSGRAGLEWAVGAEAALRLVNTSGRYAFMIVKPVEGSNGCSGVGRCLPLPENLTSHLDKHGAHIDNYILCAADGVYSESKTEDTPIVRSYAQEIISRLKQNWPIDLKKSIVLSKKNSEFMSFFNISKASCDDKRIDIIVSEIVGARA